MGAPLLVTEARRVQQLEAAAPRRVAARHRSTRIAGHRTPREMRHSFVSLLSASGMPLEHISRLVGHSLTAVTESVYRQQLQPVMQEGATAMDGIFPTRDAG